MRPASVVHVGQRRGCLFHDPVQLGFRHGINGGPGNGQFQMVRGKKLHHEVRLYRVFHIMVNPNQVGMAHLSANLGFVLEGLALLSVLSAGCEELLEGKSLLRSFLDHLHDHRSGPGMNNPDKAIIADPVVTCGTGVRIGRHSTPFPLRSKLGLPAGVGMLFRVVYYVTNQPL
jgi:hypothetical protein